MKPAFSFDEIREAEKAVIEKEGIPSIVLMENAGKNAFDIICTQVPDILQREVFILCGKGNNAGDGFVIAREMAINGINVNVVNVSDVSSLHGDALTNYNVLKNLNSQYVSFISFGEFVKSLKAKPKTLIVDAMLGSGVKGKLSMEFEQAVNFVNSLSSKKVRVAAIDVPSGLMSGEQVNPLVSADFTVTMGAIKTELLYGDGKESAGDIYIAPIGITDDVLEKYNPYKKHFIELSDIKKIFPRRKKNSYKYSNGKALIIGGSAGLSGAVIMSSYSALKSGAGAVIAAIPKTISAHFSKKLFEVIKAELDETKEGSIAKDSYDKVKKRIEKSDAVLIGPGLSLNTDTMDFLFDVIKNCDKNLIIDADGLTLLAENLTVLQNRNSKSEIILTPHIGEFSRLSKIDAEQLMNNRFTPVKDFAAKYNVNIVMKSETTFCCLKSGEIFFNSTGNENLATAGSGDVLSGILVSLLAQTKDVKSAMLCGTYLHGMTADFYYSNFGNKQTASQQDLIKLIPNAVTNILD